MECAKATQFQKGDTVCAYFMGELYLGTYDQPEAGGRHLIKDIVNAESGYQYGETGNGSLPTGHFGKWQKKATKGGSKRTTRRQTRRSRKTRGKRKH
jgi:hypothetical protein